MFRAPLSLKLIMNRDDAIHYIYKTLLVIKRGLHCTVNVRITAPLNTKRHLLLILFIIIIVAPISCLNFWWRVVNVSIWLFWIATSSQYITLTDAIASHSRPVAGAAAGGSSPKPARAHDKETALFLNYALLLPVRGELPDLANTPDLVFQVDSLQFGSATRTKPPPGKDTFYTVRILAPG